MQVLRVKEHASYAHALEVPGNWDAIRREAASAGNASLWITTPPFKQHKHSTEKQNDDKQYNLLWRKSNPNHNRAFHHHSSKQHKQSRQIKQTVWDRLLSLSIAYPTLYQHYNHDGVLFYFGKKHCLLTMILLSKSFALYNMRFLMISQVNISTKAGESW